MSTGPYITPLEIVILLNILNLFIVVKHHEYDTRIRYLDEYTANISCRNNSQIQIKNIDVQEEETICRKNTCYLNSIDKHSVQDNCNEYVTTIRYSDEYTANISCGNTSQIQIQTIDIQEEENACRKSTTVVRFVESLKEIVDSEAGEQIHTSCWDISKSVRIECETQFLVGDIKLSFEPKYKTDCKEKAIETDLNNVCRYNFNKSEQCYYSVFERLNKSDDCYDFTKNVSVKYSCVGIAAGVSGGVILTIIVMVVICLIKRSKPGKQEASSSNDNKAFDELQNDDKSQQK
ncbi:unnamed protein product [Mytilus edulis]|uniref:Uncharacterized protein n=1 Tax=Mytilus edulis TaxID=6550 RepID=A0A8S3RP38_MYTED|nr:unnamed protein product [Mytilus edulis]